MKNKLTYKEAYNMIIEAYFKDEIQPMNSEFCFCGTLSPNRYWAIGDLREKLEKVYPYSVEEYKRMESPLLKEIGASRNYRGNWFIISDHKKSLDYEDKLFKGMCNALEVLKQIHIERGEDVEEIGEVFNKRQLQKV